VKKPRLRSIKDPVSALTHLGTLIAAGVGMAIMLWTSRGNTGRMVVGSVYGASMLILYSASTLYHWIKTTEKKESILRKIDHVAVNVLIAGSGTPVLYYGLQGMWRSAMLAVVWGLTVVACCVQIFLIKGPRWLYTLVYFLLGCLVLIPIAQLIRNLPWQAMLFIGLGGAVYAAGGAIYAAKKPNLFPGHFGFHEMFHVLCTAGSALHFIGILLYVLPS
jgi:hemolysin III